MLTKKYFILALLFGVAVGLVTASVMTFLDWRLNPGNIFHNSLGMNWSVVSETMRSWFAPTFVLAILLALPTAFWFSRRG